VLSFAACFASVPALAQACEGKIGAAGPMAGGAASWGLAMKAGAEFVAAQANADGGLTVGGRKCKVTVLTFDSQYTAAGAAAAANYFASQNVKVIVGPLGAPEATGVKPVAQRNGQLTFNSSFANDAISPQFPLAFHQLTGPFAWGNNMVKAAKDRFKFSSVVIVGPNDQGGTDGTPCWPRRTKPTVSRRRSSIFSAARRRLRGNPGPPRRVRFDGDHPRGWRDREDERVLLTGAGAPRRSKGPLTSYWSGASACTSIDSSSMHGRSSDAACLSSSTTWR
jgi:hypothetical protein